MSRRKELAAMLRDVALGAEVGPVLLCSLLTDAADLLDPPADESTIEVRVLVRVAWFDDGAISYEAAGLGTSEHHGFLMFVEAKLNDYCERTRDTWITARVPKPAPVVEVEGMVDS